MQKNQSFFLSSSFFPSLEKSDAYITHNVSDIGVLCS